MKMYLLDKNPGTYVLVLRLQNSETIEVGKLGRFFFPAGFYLYTGSAFGPGGLRARIGRHLKKDKVLHWHIDYLRGNADIIEVWISDGGKREQECLWAAALSSFDSALLPINGFGSSDCGCNSHLIYFSQEPVFSGFQNLVEMTVRRIVLPANPMKQGGLIQ